MCGSTEFGHFTSCVVTEKVMPVTQSEGFLGPLAEQEEKFLFVQLMQVLLVGSNVLGNFAQIGIDHFLDCLGHVNTILSSKRM